MASEGDRRVLGQIRGAFEHRDLGLLAPLLADEVRWGDEDHPRGCRGPMDVLRTFSRLMEAGVEGEVVQLVRGPRGALCELSVQWPEGMADPSSVWQVYSLAEGKIAEIRGYEDSQSAAEAAGLL